MKHKTYCAPSWSWASHDGEVFWHGFAGLGGPGPIISGCGYLQARIDLLSSDVYGGVRLGTLTLCSRIVAVVLEHVGGGRLRASCEGVRGWAFLDEKMCLSDTSFVAIPILDDMSLLVTKNPGHGFYRRVGIWQIPKKTWYTSDLTP